jgi:subtilisin-like proprotein convertase family protein
MKPLTQGDHLFYVSAEAGAAFRLKVNGATIIDNWTHPATNTVEFSSTSWLGTNIAYGIVLEYVHFTNGAEAHLSWAEPGTSKEVIPAERFGPFSAPGNNWWSTSPTGVSVDAAGKIWAGCLASDTATRIEPNAGPLVVTPDGETNHVGLVDMIVDLGNGTWHPFPYNVEANPYNYSDMTGFNMRVVNPSLKPLKGYWTVVNDSSHAGQLWNKVSWTAAVTNGCEVAVYVRASDDRNGLGGEVFMPVTNSVAFQAIRGRFIEVRLSMVRDDPSKQPLLYDLTVYGASSGFAGDDFLFGASGEEGGEALFWTELVGAEPVGYRWFRRYSWEVNETEIVGAANSYLMMSNVDSWVAGTEVRCVVTNGNGEVVTLGPAYLTVDPVRVEIPATNYPTYQGPAKRYPLTIDVFSQPTNFNNVSVTVTLWGLSHNRSADLSILLVSPLGKGVMLMSNVGGNNGVSGAILCFSDAFSQPVQGDPLQSPGVSPWPRDLEPSNYGQVEQMPQVGLDPPPPHSGTYSAHLYDLEHDNPDGTWKLYIYDGVSGMNGHLDSSWQLWFTFQ